MQLRTFPRVLSEKEDLALRGHGKKKKAQHGHAEHYGPMFHANDGEVKVMKEEGGLLFWLIPNVLTPPPLRRSTSISRQ